MMLSENSKPRKGWTRVEELYGNDRIVSMIEFRGTIYVATEQQIFRQTMANQFEPMEFVLRDEDYADGK